MTYVKPLFRLLLKDGLRRLFPFPRMFFLFDLLLSFVSSSFFVFVVFELNHIRLRASPAVMRVASEDGNARILIFIIIIFFFVNVSLAIGDYLLLILRNNKR